MRPPDDPPSKPSFLKRILGHAQPKIEAGSELRRLEERRRAIQKATDEWLSLLREMEHEGHSGHADYERYHAAHADAKKQLKEIDLALFNIRSRL